MNKEFSFEAYTQLIMDRTSCLNERLDSLESSKTGRTDEVALRYFRKVLNSFDLINLIEYDKEYSQEENFDFETPSASHLDKAKIEYPHFAASFDMNEIINSVYDAFNYEGDVNLGGYKEEFLDVFGGENRESLQWAMNKDLEETRQRYADIQEQGLLMAIIQEVSLKIEEYRVNLLYSQELYGIDSPDNLDEKVEEYQHLMINFINKFKVIATSEEE